jgi:hypothetical protein
MSTFTESYSERMLPCGTTLVFDPLGGESGLLEFYSSDSLHGALVSYTVAEEVLTRACALAVIPDPRIAFTELVPVWEY